MLTFTLLVRARRQRSTLTQAERRHTPMRSRTIGPRQTPPGPICLRVLDPSVPTSPAVCRSEGITVLAHGLRSGFCGRLMGCSYRTRVSRDLMNLGVPARECSRTTRYGGSCVIGGFTLGRTQTPHNACYCQQNQHENDRADANTPFRPTDGFHPAHLLWHMCRGL